MTMYWPDQKVALVIEDDPSGADFDERECPGWTVVRTCCDQVDSLEGMRDLADELADAVGQPRVEPTPEWCEANERLFNELNSCPW